MFNNMHADTHVIADREHMFQFSSAEVVLNAKKSNKTLKHNGSFVPHFVNVSHRNQQYHFLCFSSPFFFFLNPPRRTVQQKQLSQSNTYSIVIIGFWWCRGTRVHCSLLKKPEDGKIRKLTKMSPAIKKKDLMCIKKYNVRRYLTQRLVEN